MKNLLLLFFGIILTINCYSQISFEKGYYINNSDEKVECLIKNIDWKNNPIDFKYKFSENDTKKTASINSVKEFGIYNTSKYIRKTVDIDRSSKKINDLSTVKNPIFNEEELFLKVLVEGSADLFLYADGSLKRYFYNKKNSTIEQLVFKSYKTPDNEIGTNNQYKGQLWNNLKCPTFKISQIKNIAYKKNELIDFFVEYNKCNNQEFVNYEEKQKKDLFNLNIRPGVNNSSLSLQQSTFLSSRNIDFGSELSFRLGIEAEFIMPFNKNKWAVLIEPTYQYFKSEKEVASRKVKADYKSIEIPVGVRHYFFLNSNSKIFINGSFIFDLSQNSKIEFDPGSDLEIKTRNNLAFGLGYKHNDTYSLEFRYQTNREIISEYVYWNSKYNTVSVIFGYSLF